ncbi:class II histone deacetylase [Aliiroseovarius subalbicans]|uniref:class II histone deacetylase n=1 Tax=Aliiroseovarius subalbicans TaxID=2925840 RepID=UPI001F5728CB|nr:class II histone deacetylase [Aliiroseovarius subalbicans]MCI2400368.1 class II histone deacetylase [Aliiroseovarius subalbicans]
MTTGFFWDERCFWHSGGNYAGTVPVGGLVQPLAAGGLPESPETKRRLKNLIDVTGLSGDLDLRGADEASFEDLARVHPPAFLRKFKDVSDAGGGELGLRTPFGQGGYEIAALSAGLSIAALEAVLRGEVTNAYALSRPPGHHCLPEFPNGFCLLANLAIAIRAAQAKGLAKRVVVVDWDVHHGNGTEAVFINDPDVLTISLHQERNYPLDTGDAEVRGEGAGEGANMNIPLPPGAGHATYLEAMERLALPAIRAHAPDVIVIACGYDAAAIDPLSRMLATADTFRQMTRMVTDLAGELCDGRLMMAHEGGYSEVYVPFCGHAVLEEMSGSDITAPDPLADIFAARQPSPRLEALYSDYLGELVAFFGLSG